MNEGFVYMQIRPRTVHPIAGELVDMWNNYENAEELHEVDEQEVDEQEDSSPDKVLVADKAQKKQRTNRHMAKVRKAKLKKKEKSDSESEYSWGPTSDEGEEEEEYEEEESENSATTEKGKKSATDETET